VAPLCNLRRWRRRRLVSLVLNRFYMIHIYFIKFIKAFFFLRKGCRPWGYIARLFLSVLLCYLLLCFYDIHIKSFRDSRLRSYWIYIYIYIHDMTNTLYRYMYIIYFLSLVKVAIGIDSSVVTVALVLIRTPCRRPGMRSYRPAYLDGDRLQRVALNNCTTRRTDEHATTNAKTTHLKDFSQAVGFVSTYGPMVARVEAVSKSGRFHRQRFADLAHNFLRIRAVVPFLGGSTLKVWWREKFCTYKVLQYRFVVHVQMCSKQNTRRTTGTRRDTHHGQYKGTHPRASLGRALRC